MTNRSYLRTAARLVCLTILLLPALRSDALAQTTATVVRDTFTAADGTVLHGRAPDVNLPGGAWTTDGSPGVVMASGGARAGGWGNFTASLIEGGTPNGAVSTDWQPLGSESAYGPFLGLMFRATDANNFIQAGYWYGVLHVMRYVNGTPTLLGSLEIGSAGTAPHNLKVTLAGPNIGLWWDGQLKFTVTDTMFVAATKVGVRFANPYDYTSRYDNFTVESPPCADTIGLTPQSRSMTAAATSGAIAINTYAACSWTASSSAAWLTLTSATSGSGVGALQYSVAANTGGSSDCDGDDRQRGLYVLSIERTACGGESGTTRLVWRTGRFFTAALPM